MTLSRAVSLSLLLVLSSVAPAAGAPIPESRTDLRSDEAVVADLDSTEMYGRVNNSSDGFIQVVVHLQEVERARLTADVSTNVNRLKRHASRTQEDFRDAVSQLDGARVINTTWLVNTALIEIRPGDISRLKDLPQVEGVYPNHGILTLPRSAGNEGQNGETDNATLTSTNYTYGLRQVNAPATWNRYNTTGEGVRVAIIDTGVDADHPDFQVTAFREFNDEGRLTGRSAFDPNGHGTHVSGIVAGGEASGLPGTPHIGVAPGVKLLMLKAYDADTQSFPLFATVSAMQWAVKEGNADIVSMSFGGSPGGFHIKAQRNLRAAGVVPVAASGNGGRGTIDEPAATFDSIAVGATNEQGEIASFSAGMVIHVPSMWEEGAWLGSAGDHPWVGEEVSIPPHWPRTFVVPDFAAPGVHVTSTAPVDQGKYATMSGTSMAAPFVSGVVALMLSASNETHTVGEIENVLEQTAFKPTGGSAKPDTRYGHGIVDALNATARLVGPGGVLTGRVTDSQGARPGVTVRTADGVSTTTNESGVYRLYLPPGEHTVKTKAFGYAAETANVTIEANRSRRHDVTLSEVVAADLRKEQPATLPAGGEFEIRVDVRNLASYAVSLTDESTITAEHVTVLFDGKPVELGSSISLTEPLDENLIPIHIIIDWNATIGSSFGLTHAFAGPGTDVIFQSGLTEIDSKSSDSVFELSDLEAPSTVVLGSSITPSVTVTNTGKQPAQKEIQYVLNSTMGRFSLPVDTIELSAGETTVYETSVSGFDEYFVPGAVVEHGFQVGDSVVPDDGSEPQIDDSISTKLGIATKGTRFVVSDLNAPNRTAAGENITIGVNVTNIGATAGVREVELVFAGEPVNSTTVELGGFDPSMGNDTASVTFDVTVPTDLSEFDIPYAVRVGDSIQNKTIRAPGTIKGTITDTSGNPIEGILIKAENGHGMVYRARSDGGGTYEINGLYSRYFVVNPVNASEREGILAVITVDPGRVTTRNFTIRSRVSVSGTVVDAETGEPIEDARVFDADGDAFSAVTDSNGTFELEGLRNGTTIAVRANAEGYNRSNISFLQVGVNGPLRFALDPSQTTVAQYATDEGRVDTTGLRDAIDDWRTGVIDTGLLRRVIDAWRTGDQIDTVTRRATG